MKKQATIFAIISIALSVIGLLVHFIEGILVHIFEKHSFWFLTDSSVVVQCILIIFLAVVIPTVLFFILYILSALFAINPKLGKSSVINVISIIFVIFLLPIILYGYKELLNWGLINHCIYNTSVYYLVSKASHTPIADTIFLLASSSSVIANAFAVSEKKPANRAKVFSIISFIFTGIALLFVLTYGSIDLFSRNILSLLKYAPDTFLIFIVFCIFAVVIPLIFYTALLLIFNLFALNAKPGKKTFVNYLPFILNGLIISPIVMIFETIANKICISSGIDISFLNAALSTRPVALILYTFATLTLFAASVFAIATKKQKITQSPE